MNLPLGLGAGAVLCRRKRLAVVGSWVPSNNAAHVSTGHSGNAARRASMAKIVTASLATVLLLATQATFGMTANNRVFRAMWNGVDNATNYCLYRRVQGTTNWSDSECDIPTTSFDWSLPAQPGQTYEFTVSARNNFGESPRSSPPVAVTIPRDGGTGNGLNGALSVIIMLLLDDE